MAIPDRMDERLRALNLVEGQRKASTLFAEVTRRGLIAAGLSEYETTDRIGDLARELWGTRVRWPGRIVRSGPHALFPCGGEPPADRVIGAGDTVTAHFGPLLVGHGTDYTRTVVLGDDPAELRLREDLPAIFAAGRAAFHADARITGRQLYAELGALAAKSGWSLGGRHAGHLAGEVPAANPMCARADAYIGPDNDQPLRRTTAGGWQAHWLLEIHLVDEHAGFAGAHKALLDLV
ncbi:M24 family metallopeptidase [Streptomyces erythrochromogenes]|uniref:M24 family metallopeptidase n=1 Tax=Streptomyces erythrochromogenes TaxID=285574 RepID=UPI0036B4A987